MIIHECWPWSSNKLSNLQNPEDFFFLIWTNVWHLHIPILQKVYEQTLGAFSDLQSENSWKNLLQLWRLLNLPPIFNGKTRSQTEGSRFPLLSSNVRSVVLRGLEVDPNSLQHNPMRVAWSRASIKIKRFTVVNTGWILSTHSTTVLFLHCSLSCESFFSSYFIRLPCLYLNIGSNRRVENPSPAWPGWLLSQGHWACVGTPS